MARSAEVPNSREPPTNKGPKDNKCPEQYLNIVTRGLDALTRLVRSCVPRAHDDDAGGCRRNGVRTGSMAFVHHSGNSDSGTYQSMPDYDCE